MLDIACGPGMQTLHLAEVAPSASITAVDFLPAYVAEAQRRVITHGTAERVTIAQGDMRDLGFEAESFDVIWCEGAVYVIGVETALQLWRAFLKPGGYLAFTENVWILDDVPESIKGWWRKHYSAMHTLEECSVLCERLGYEQLERFVLPESDWWDDYYTPMIQRIALLRAKYEVDQIAIAVLDESQEEIDMYREYHDCYGYTFFVLKKPV